jgi:hypothetical protein
MSKTITAQDAARALRAIPSDVRSEASRVNGRKMKPGHGGRPKFARDTYTLAYSGPTVNGEERGGSVATYDDAAEIALSVLAPLHTLTIYRGESTSPSARWTADENGKVRRVQAF